MTRRRSKAATAAADSRAIGPDVTRAASIAGAFGGTGTGKSTWLKRQLAAAPGVRTIIFDPGREYQLGAVATSESDFQNLVDRRVLSIVFRPGADSELRWRQFDRFCACGLAIADTLGECRVLADELHLVTDAGNAPAAWSELVTTGRKRGISVLAGSIRPAAIDKDFWTNCTRVHVGRLNFVDDQKTLANVLGVKPAELAELKSDAGGCDFLERDLLSGQLTRGRLTF